MLKTNVIGANGIIMQSKAKRLDGTFDRQDNERIEKAFKRWGHKEFVSVTGKLSWAPLVLAVAMMEVIVGTHCSVAKTLRRE